MSKTPVLFVMLAILAVLMPVMALSSSHGNDQKPMPGKSTPAMLAKGQAIYEKSCAFCHATGVAGAPKLGDKDVWKARNKSGFDHLVEMAIRGKGAMPPRGGNSALSDDDIRAAVTYILENSW